jgi:UDP-N-acetylglucosamine 2-epimerase (non-hydrolysing)/GDP/UDP-N,N'-diacetylbacillosamine 2-epimerase (hydrolysing)
MSHLHFTSTEEYRNRVIQLGEDPTRVFNVGAPAIENMRRSTLLSSQELEKSLNFILGDSPLLVTYHPVTLEKDGGVASLKSLLRVLDEKVVSHQIVMTFPNSDAHSTELIALLQAFAAKYPTKTLLVKSLGQLRYLSLMKVSRAVVGNSSSGLIEAPAFGVPTVDIGTRQNGRLRLESVIRAEDNFDSINRAVSEALSNEHLALSKTAANPFGDGKTSAKIVSILSLTDFGSILLKKFHDLETPCVSAS